MKGSSFFHFVVIIVELGLKLVLIVMEAFVFEMPLGMAPLWHGPGPPEPSLEEECTRGDKDGREEESVEDNRGNKDDGELIEGFYVGEQEAAEGHRHDDTRTADR
eukprot:Sspe_Gene.6156::Locus_2061_Transcript_1_1_Confidence_1.000_Length_3134::g.6156::m.6156